MVARLGPWSITIGTALDHVPPERACAAAGILTTTQQFGVASGVAIIGAVFYARLGPGRASSVSAMVLAMAIGTVIVLAAAADRADRPGRGTPARPGAGAHWCHGPAGHS